ncbi:alanine racemase [Aneurinibacillus tyrosinisolvens]|uniref:alanine racemase n=1 Tax=Aneurinibacillus tyrosinisolvens TaxID=1443435 RepID=UPI00063F2088|nr:alanine racemase [Aneurinibacillus tyrosinisolvens]
MVNKLSTPVVIVDLDIVEKNISKMAEKVKKAGIKHRPHIKTHKSVYFAKMQQRAGISGITCAKLGEAEIMAEAGFNDILIAFPIVGEDKLERFYQLAKKINVRTCIDSIDVAQSLSNIGAKLNKPIQVYIEVDGGIHRCGRQPGEDTLQFANLIKNLPGIKIIGLLTYAGQIYSKGTFDEIAKMAEEEAKTIKQTADILRNAGFSIQAVSAGSSISSKFVENMEGVTEVRAGNYIFNDVSQLSTGMVTIDECALRVIATVVSTPSPGKAIIDAGSKTLTTDTTHFGNGFGYIIEHPGVEIFKLNEEHGFLRFDPSVQLHIGQRLTIIPNHACVIPNLCDELIGVRGGEIIQSIPVDARGKNK